ncbi:MAG: hypothetical protein WED10_14065 [Brumimicrobium sp.]
MKIGLYILALFMAENLAAQEIEYSINFPPIASMWVEHLPDSIDTNHYYSHLEVVDLPEPANGWAEFYDNIDTLEYPQEAKEQKLQSAMEVVYKIDEKGFVDTVYIKSVESYGHWEKCPSCEALILDVYKNTKWSPGKIGDVPVKTVDFTFVEFTIRDPQR